jgi:hypothetical protein
MEPLLYEHQDRLLARGSEGQGDLHSPTQGGRKSDGDRLAPAESGLRPWLQSRPRVRQSGGDPGHRAQGGTLSI